MKKLSFTILLLFVPQLLHAAPVVISADVELSAEKAFALWTSNQGVQSFFAPGSEVTTGVGGGYNIYFFPEREVGKRGVEGARILIYEPAKRLAFTWDQPTFYPETRGQNTWVLVTFESLGEQRTRVVLRHDGFGTSEQWRNANAYFEGAWPVVMQRFAWVVKNGAVDWKNPPAGLMYDPDLDAIQKRARSI